MEGHFAKFCPKSVAMATSLEKSEKEVRTDKTHADIFHLVKKKT